MSDPSAITSAPPLPPAAARLAGLAAAAGEAEDAAALGGLGRLGATGAAVVPPVLRAASHGAIHARASAWRFATSASAEALRGREGRGGR